MYATCIYANTTKTMLTRQEKANFIADVETVAEAIMDEKEDISDKGEHYFGGTASTWADTIGYYGFQTESETIICSFYKKTEIINRNDPDLQTSESSHVEVKFYIESDFPQISELDIDEVIDIARDRTKDQTQSQTGYFKGYRLTALEETAKSVANSIE